MIWDFTKSSKNDQQRNDIPWDISSKTVICFSSLDTSFDADHRTFLGLLFSFCASIACCLCHCGLGRLLRVLERCVDVCVVARDTGYQYSFALLCLWSSIFVRCSGCFLRSFAPFLQQAGSLVTADDRRGRTVTIELKRQLALSASNSPKYFSHTTYRYRTHEE